MIKFNKIGILQNGKTSGWNIAIKDDTCGATGGYYVFEWYKDEFFDDWFENFNELLINLENRIIEWTDQDYVSPNT